MSKPVKNAASAVPGIQTFVSDKSTLNLPTNIDREKESVLPPGSAHPGSGGRDIGKFEFNRPDNDIDKRPRTKGQDGEEYGSPYKDDTAGVTRRTMTATQEMVSRIVESYRRQRRQRGVSRTKSRQYYQRNKARIKMRAKQWRRRNKNNPRHKRNVLHRRRFPSQHRRMAFFETRTTEPTKQRRRTPTERRKEHREYQMNRRLKIRKSLRRYHQFCAHSSKCHTQRRKYRDNPDRYHRRPPRSKEKTLEIRRERDQERRDRQKQATAELTGIGFSLAPSMDAGFVNSINPETGVVTFSLAAIDTDTESEPPEIHDLPLPVFMEVAVFYDDADIDAFFELVDSTVGEDAYEALDEATVRGCAEIFDAVLDTPEAIARCRHLVEHGDLAKMDAGELTSILDLIVKSPSDVSEMISRIASRKMAGDVILYNQENPKQETEQPGANTSYSAQGPGTYQHKPDEKEGVPSGSSLPNTHVDNVPAGSSRVVPNGEGQLWSGDATYMMASQRTAATIPELMSATSPKVVSKAKDVRPRVKRADPKNGIWTFSIPGSDGNTYTARVKVLREGNAKVLHKHHVLVSCTCDFFRWQGPEHWAKVDKYLYGKPAGSATKPVEKDPNGQHRVCKHLAACFDMARKFRLAAWSLG